MIKFIIFQFKHFEFNNDEVKVDAIYSTLNHNHPTVPVLFSSKTEKGGKELKVCPIK